MAELQVFLVDNGSLQPAATRQLRRLAKALGKMIGREVAPVSLLHASAVPARRLGGRKAEIFEPALRRRAEGGARDFVVIPLFIGPRRALTEYLPECVRRLRTTFAGLRVSVARPLARVGEECLSQLVEACVRKKLTPSFLCGGSAKVAVVDHGSPLKAVAAARNRIARQLRARLGRSVAKVTPCSMERRPGAAYAFNEPLLENLLATPPWNEGPVIVAQLFLLPGRHAGPRGDIAAICRRARKKNPGLRTARTRLLGEHPGLVEILAGRFRTVVHGRAKAGVARVSRPRCYT